MVQLAQLNPLRSSWLAGANHRRDVEHSVRRAYASWLYRFPCWANTGFDEYFLLHDALPLLNAMLSGEQYADPAHLAQAWVQAFGIAQARRARAVAADFRARLQRDYAMQITIQA